MVSIRAPVRGATGEDLGDAFRGAGAVSIRAPVRGATEAGIPSTHRIIRFNPRPRAGGDATRYYRCDAVVFQSAPPCGGRREGVVFLATQSARFNPRPRAGGDLGSAWSPACRAGCFNPRPRAGGDELLLPPDPGIALVSIRAPVRGATPKQPSTPSTKQSRFQSAPPCGGRHTRADRIRSDQKTFQSAPPCGGRRRALREARPDEERVSIRAPVRGATSAAPALSCARPSRFNPRPRAGGDPAGVYPTPTIDLVSIRAPVRGATWARHGRQHAEQGVSIRAPVRGATRDAVAWTDIRPSRFNPRPRAGGDSRIGRGHRPRSRGFNPRPRAGGDFRTSAEFGPPMFQSAPPCGGRRAPCRRAAAARWRGFNPRPRAGGDVVARHDLHVEPLFQSAPPCGGRREAAG